MKILLLEGWPASGKTSIWGMLDGCKDIFVEPLHTYMFQGVFELFDDEEDHRIITIRELRAALASTEYFKIQQYAASRFYPISIASNENSTHKFIFDFYKFDEEIVSKICCNLPIGAREFIHIIYSTFIKIYCGIPPSDFEYCLSMTNYDLYKKNNIRRFPNIFKVLNIQRDPIEIFSSRISRLPRDEDGVKTNSFAPSKRDLWISSDIEEIASYNLFFNRKKDNHLIYVYKLKEVLSNKKSFLDDLSIKLSVEFSEKNLFATRDDEPIETEKLELTGQVNDNPKDLLSFFENLVASIRLIIWSFHKLPVNLLSIYAITRFLYHRFRGWR